MTYDLVIQHGVRPTEMGPAEAAIGISDGLIQQIGGRMRGRREINAGGRPVLPGGIDVHVHLSPPGPAAPGVEQWVDDFHSGSLAALAGGVTTIGNMTFQRPGEALRDALARDAAAAQRECLVDFVLHPVLRDPTPRVLDQIGELAGEGVTSLKLFLVQDDFEARVDLFLRAMHTAAAHGMLVMVHCEDGPVNRFVGARLVEQGRSGPAHFPESRPTYAEAAATERAIAYARATGAAIYVVHLSSAAALHACRRGRAEGTPVHVETRPLYLHLTRERFAEPDGAKYAGAPPLREASDVEALWRALDEGEIDCVCSDHAPWTLRQKLASGLDVRTLRQGVADLETLMPMLFSEGVDKGRLSLSRFVEVTSTNAARLFGLYPQKGAIRVGSDADIVVWDPDRRAVVDGATMRSRAGYSVYDGRVVRGWPACTISRGEVLFEEGEITGRPGRGRWLRRVSSTTAP